MADQNKKTDKKRRNKGKNQKYAFTRMDYAKSRYGKAAIARTGHLILFVIITILVTFAIWASHARINQVTKGTGKIIPPENVSTVQGIDKGEIRAIYVEEGQNIEKNDKLVSIVETEAESAYKAKRDRYKALQANIARLQAQASGEKQLTFPQSFRTNYPEIAQEQVTSFQKSRENLRDRISVLQERLQQKKERIDKLTSRKKSLQSIVRLSKQEKDMIRPLVEKGSAPEIELIKLERNITEHRATYNKVVNSIPEARSARQEIKQEIRQVHSEYQSKAQNKLSEKLSEFKQLDSELKSLEERKSRTTLRAPVRGTIKAIHDNVGGVVKPGEKLIEIVPRSGKLLVEAKIKPRDISFVHPGQKARIQITAYDFTVYGQMTGKVEKISPDSFQDKKGNIFYKVRVTADHPSLQHDGKDFPLKSGMTANVNIISNKQTVMDYILKPFKKTFSNALQEH